MFKLMRSVKIYRGIQNTPITSNALVQRSFCDQQKPLLEKTINAVKLLGRVGAEPNQRGSEMHPIVTFSVATHSSFKKADGEYGERVDWHQVIVFKPHLRELTKNYVVKGQRVLLYGRLAYSEVTDVRGNSRQTSNIIADEIVCL